MNATLNVLAQRSPTRSERFDQKNLQEACQDNITRRSHLARFFPYKLHDRGQPALAANLHELREQPDQQGRVRRAGQAVAHKQWNLWRPALIAEAELTMQQRDGHGIDVLRSGRLATRHPEAIRREAQGKVTLLKLDRLVSVDRAAARAVEDHALEGLPAFRATNTPRTCAADDFRERGMRSAECDNLRAWIDHG